MNTHLTRIILSFLVILGLLIPSSQRSIAQAAEVVIEMPELHPAFTTCAGSYWYPILNDRGYTAYLTLNADFINSFNQGEWHPLIPQAGYYRVEAYIPAHNAITWCTGQNPPTISTDTTEARYTVHHGFGITKRSLSQFPHSNEWIDLGEYFFNSGQSGYISLSDENAEQKFTTTVSFSAMRFTFTRPTRPILRLPLVFNAYTPIRPPANVRVIQAQGFDACHLPEIAEMQAWWNNSPYSFYGLYLGGIHLPGFCKQANTAWVNAVHQQGWSFVPIWVGPQAPCTTYAYRMSSDPIISYQEGRREAEAASSTAAALGLANYNLGGTIIYYDLEAYGVSSQACRQPVSAFINGWVERLHELGNFAAAYGTRNSYVSDWANIANVPDGIWPASWYTTVYDPYASVYGIDWLEGLWTNHQRIRQYAGDHGETWGNIRMGIDSNVAEGMVAMPPTTPLGAVEITKSPAIGDTGWLTAEQGWLISDNRLYWTNNQGSSWQDVSPGIVQVAAFLSSGQAWALGSQDAGKMTLYHSTDWGLNWESLELHLPPDSWHPIQLQFTTTSSGWVVLQKETSQAFDIGILMTTQDSGLTWQSYDLPIAATIQFTSQAEGWMITRAGNSVYRTGDGGRSWQPASSNQAIQAQLSLPEGSTFHGKRENGLGWAVASQGSCSGEKTAPGFACQTDTTVWQTSNNGQSWQSIPLPNVGGGTP